MHKFNTFAVPFRFALVLWSTGATVSSLSFRGCPPYPRTCRDLGGFLLHSTPSQPSKEWASKSKFLDTKERRKWILCSLQMLVNILYASSICQHTAVFAAGSAARPAGGGRSVAGFLPFLPASTLSPVEISWSGGSSPSSSADRSVFKKNRTIQLLWWDEMEKLFNNCWMGWDGEFGLWHLVPFFDKMPSMCVHLYIPTRYILAPINITLPSAFQEINVTIILICFD